MKKIYVILLLCCANIAAFAQTVTIRAVAPAGTYITGNSNGTTRTDDNIAVAATAQAGYAVFDLSAIPPNANIIGVDIHFYVTSVTGGGMPTANTRGYAGDLSTITAPAALLTAMSGATSLSTANYGTMSNSSRTVGSTATSLTFIGANIGNKVSICFTGTGTRLYNITGETGAASNSGVHAPYLVITYNCAGLSGVSATGPTGGRCPGAPFSLTGAATGAVSYQWNGPAGFSTAIQNPNVPDGLPTTGIYTLTAYGSDGCYLKDTALATVDVVVPATVTPLTDLAFCAGGSAALDAPLVVLGQYQWYDDAGSAISGETNPTYFATATGSYYVKITDANNCIDSSAPTAVVELVTPPLSPSGNAGVCVGNTRLLTVNTNGVIAGISFQWQKDGADITGAVSNTYTAATSGTYQCQLSVGGGVCTAASETVTLVVNPLPSPAINYTGTMLRTGAAYATYQWYLNTIAVPGATSYSLAAPNTGSYRVRVTDTNGCVNLSPAYAVNTVGVNEVSTAADVSIYPNPAYDVLHIVSPVAVRVVISSIEGKAIIMQQGPKDMDISRLANGLYLVAIYNETGERLMVQKLMKD